MSATGSENGEIGQKIVKLAEGGTVGMINATHISRQCKKLAKDHELVRAEHLRQAVAREIMKRDDTGEHAEDVREIMTKSDVKLDPYAELDPCPGCGREWGQASFEYNHMEYKGEHWHTSCVYEDHPDVEKVDPERVCPKCYDFVPFRKVDQEEGGRICPTCKMTFPEHVSLTKQEYLERQNAENDQKADK